jgi:hypothetical protein
MSKWFASAQEISESESSDSSDEEKKPTIQQASKAAPVKSTGGAASQARNKFIQKFGDSSESEEETRVVKTGQDKKREYLN